jgi:hypothetical protein
MSRRWTKKETYALLQGASIYGQSWFTRRIPRSLSAIRAKAQRLYSGGLSRGSMSLAEASRRTGYHVTQLRRAQEATRQKWKRTSASGTYLIHEDQLEELVDWLAQDYWSAVHRLYGCIWCSTSRRDHYAAGLCRRCYARHVARLRRAGWPRELDRLRVQVEAAGIEDSRLLGSAIESFRRGRVPDERVMLRVLELGCGSS